MLEHTFCQIPGIGIKTERLLWEEGILHWDDMNPERKVKACSLESSHVQKYIHLSKLHLSNKDPSFFYHLLPASEVWRLIPHFLDRLLYFDIETTGLGREDQLTTIASYDGETIRTYVHGENLEDFLDDLRDDHIFVTYNGRAFDVPFLCRYFKIKLKQLHIDLRPILFSFGYRGGLKGCEKALGIERNELDGVNGYSAVLLWNEYMKNKNPKTLETLLAYNITDVINLEIILSKIFQKVIDLTPFALKYFMPLSQPPAINVHADENIIRMILNRGAEHD